MRKVRISDQVVFGEGLPLMAGPCVLENEEKALAIARHLQQSLAGYPVIFKASFDKANRSSRDSFRGVGLAEGLRILRRVKEETKLPLLVDFHEPSQAAKLAEVVDILQIPAFLCRQTDMVLAAADTGRVVNIKKGQFVAPEDAGKIVEKALLKTDRILLTERGYTFGYNNLVVDMRALVIMGKLGCPVIFDASHSVQLPGGGKETGGMRDMILPLARAAAATGIDGLFIEVYDVPKNSPSDSTTIFPLAKIREAYLQILAFHQLRHQSPAIGISE